MSEREELYLDDVINGFMSIRKAFGRAGLEPPVAIHLASHDEGMRMLAVVSKMFVILSQGDPRAGIAIEMADGSVYMQIELVGIKVRWPAKKRAKLDGLFFYS